MPGLFITSTGTGIGKTTVISELINYDRAQQQVLTASKPVISGWPEDRQQQPQTDTGLLLTALAQPLSLDNIEAISPWRLAPALSPDMAARQTGQPIDFDRLISYSSQLIKTKQLHLIEGVGGIMVPLTHQHTVLDWMLALACPCVLVVGNYLGTLSHTLTALQVLTTHQIPIEAIIINDSCQSEVPLDENCQSLQHFYPNIPLYPIGWQQTFPWQTLPDGLISFYQQCVAIQRGLN